MKVTSPTNDSKNETEEEKEKKTKLKEALKRSTSYLLGLLNGLNQKWKCFAIFYFFHFFLIWIAIAMLILMSPFVKSGYVWGVLVLV